MRIDENLHRADIFRDYIDLMTNLKARLPEILSYQGRNRGVRVENIRFAVPTSLVNPDLEQEAVEKGTSYAIPVKADISFTDANGNPRKQETKTLFRLPFPTAKGGFIVDGSVVQTRNQLRLSPGIYVTRQADGIQAFINSKSRQNIKINYSPETMKMRFAIGGRSFPAYSVLRILGVPDDQMRKTWGDQIFRANYRSTTTDNETVHRLYETMLRYTGTARNSAEKQQQIQEAFASTELDPWVSGVTLGKNFKTADRHAILESTRKILDVGSGKVKPDNRDDLYFQDIYGFNDLLLYGVESQAKKIRNKLAYRVDNQQYSEDDIMARPLSEIRKLMSSKFVQADVVYNPDQVNPIGMMSDSSEVTQMGEGGVGSTYSITEGMRDLQDSSMGFLDPVFTPTSDRVGVNMHMAAGARKVGRDMKVALLDFTRGKQGSAVAMGPRDVYDKYVAIPGEYSPREGGTYLPNKTKVRAMHKGEIVEVPYSKVDYVFMSPHHTFDWATLLIPFLPNNTPTRSTMSVKQSTHALMLAEPETPLVQAGIYRDADGQMTTSEQEFAKKFSRRVPSYMGDSEVVKVTDKSITLRDIKTGETEEVKLYNDYLLNGSNVLSEIPSVAKGDVVKQGQTIATSNFAKDGKLAMGRNLRIAYMPWHGWNFMDGLVISEDAARKMRAVHVDQIDTSARKHDRFSKGKFVALYPREYKATQLESLDDEGVIQVGAKVNPGDPLILKLTPRRLTQEDVLAGNVSQAMKQQLTRDDKVWESETPGVVQKVIRTPQGIKVIVRSERPVRVGDKLSNRHQAKGVVAAIIPNEDMPHTKEGISFDILQNPAAVPSRINAGQILETAAAKIAAHTGKPYITELFELKGMAKDNPAAIMKKLKEYGLSDQEPLYDSKGNPIMDGSRHVQVLGGFQYFTRQKQEAEPYFNARNRNDPYDIVSQRPIKGPKMGGLGFYALLAHGATKNLQEIATVKSEKNDDFWRAVEEGQNIPTPQMTFAFKKLQALLKGASIDVRQQGDDYRVMPLTDAEVLNMSAGEIPNPAMATRIGRPGKYEMLQSYDGGLYDEKLLGGLQGDRWGHISLVEPLPNPIYEKAIRGILGLAQGEYDGLIEGKLGYLNGKVIQRERNDGSLTGGNAFRQMLSSINVDDEVRRLREEVVTQKGTAKDAMIKKLRYLGALQQMGIKPEEAYIVSKVPVLPPQFRPVYLTKDNEIRVSDFTALYQDIGSMATTMKEGQQSLPESMRNELRANTYDALKALQISSTGTGYGARPRTGILEYLKGQSASWGHFQDKIFDKRQSVGGRMVIRPNPGLSVDQVGIPEDTAWKMYHSFVMRRLTKDGMLPLDARKMVEDREPLAEAALQAEMKARPVMITRDPKLHKFNIMAVYPIMVPGKSMELSPLIAKGFNADFDGDALNITVPVTEGAVREAREKMLPSKNLFKPGKDQVIMRPEEDTIAGLYYGTRFVDPRPDKFYETEREILEAYQSRELSLTDGVMLGAGKSAVMVTPGRIMVNRALPEEFKVGIDVILDNAKIGQILNKVGKEAPGKYVDTLRKLADLGNEFNTRAGLSFSLMDFMPVSREELKVMPAAGGQLTKSQIEAIDGRMKQSINSRSALAVLADSGAKGSWDKVRQMIYSPVTISGFEGPIPHVVQSGYADGLDFMDYWVAAKGNRPALYTSSIEVRDPGYFSKQLLRSTLGSVITPGDEAPEEGIQFPINHPTVLYRYLAADLISPKGVTVAQAGDAITEDVLASAQAQGVTTVSVRSPLTSKAKMGYYAKDFGRLPGGEKPRVGADIGVISSHTLTEPAVQLSLRAFHGGGAAMSANQVEGLHAIWPLLNGRAPAAVKATMAPVAGKVKSVSKMRGGGYSIAMEDGSQFNTSTNANLMIHPGQTIELGTQVNEGLMDPNEILKYRGLRPMQNYLVDQIEKNYGSNAPDRRYIETVVASLTRYGKVLNPGGHQDLMTGDVKDIRELEAINRDSDEQTPVEFEPVFDGMDYDLSKNEKDWGVKMLGRDMIRQLQESASMGLLSPFKSTKPVMPFLRGIDFGETLQETGLY